MHVKAAEHRAWIRARDTADAWMHCSKKRTRSMHDDLRWMMGVVKHQQGRTLKLSSTAHIRLYKHTSEAALNTKPSAISLTCWTYHVTPPSLE